MKKQIIEVWNDMKVSKRWQYLIFLEELSFGLWLQNRLSSSSLTNEKMYLKDSDDIKKAPHQHSSVQREPGPCSLGCYPKPETF